MIDSLAEPYENAVQLLCTIPGVDRSSTITMISEIGKDMTQFSVRITRAITAVARMILTVICHMLSTGEAWNPTAYSPVQNTRVHFISEAGHRLFSCPASICSLLC